MIYILCEQNSLLEKGETMSSKTISKIEKTIQITAAGVGKPTETMYDNMVVNRLSASGRIAVMAAESLPSLSIDAGKRLTELSTDKVEQAKLERIYHEMIEANMRTANGNDFAMEFVGLSFMSKVTAPSSYKGHIGSVEQYEIELGDNAEALVVAAAIKGYVQEQDAVTIRSFVPSKGYSNNVWSFNCGRIITDSEMSNIVTVLKRYSINPDEDVALVTSKDGIDILKISGIKQSLFRKVPGILSGVLKGKAYACDNLFADNGYIGADSWCEARRVYLKIIADFNACNDHFQVSFDLLEQKRRENRKITHRFVAQHSLHRLSALAVAA